jgi:hypothetical protein
MVDFLACMIALASEKLPHLRESFHYPVGQGAVDKQLIIVSVL